MTARERCGRPLPLTAIERRLFMALGAIAKRRRDPATLALIGELTGLLVGYYAALFVGAADGGRS